jgi:hypothetical protein
MTYKVVLTTYSDQMELIVANIKLNDKILRPVKDRIIL